MSTGSSFLLAAGGPEERQDLLAPRLPSGATVIAADGGWRLARALGLETTLLIGDMDTLSAAEVDIALSEGTQVRRFSSDKDQSDLELAIEAAHASGANRVTLIGALGGQWDHCLANLLAPLEMCRSLGMWGRLLTGTAEIYLLGPGSYRLASRAGQRMSVAALSSEVHGLSLQGFQYPLSAGVLLRRQTLGLANMVVTEEATVSLTAGEMLLTLVF